MNEQCDSNILPFFRNGITWCNIIPMTVTLIAFDLYSKFSEQCPTSCLGIAVTLLVFIKSYKNPRHPFPRLLKSSKNPHFVSDVLKEKYSDQFFDLLYK